MGGGCVGGCAGQGYLDGGRAPGDEGCEAAFADAEEGFVDLEDDCQYTCLKRAKKRKVRGRGEEGEGNLHQLDRLRP